jgi:hypothetical protein
LEEHTAGDTWKRLLLEALGRAFCWIHFEELSAGDTFCWSHMQEHIAGDTLVPITI